MRQNQDPLIEKLYDKYAKMRLSFELGGKYIGEYSISDTGLYIALTVNIELSNGQGTYEGSMKDKQFHGEGTHTYYDHRFNYQIYKGEWNMGKYHYRGRITYTNGVEFVGQFSEGRKHGVGKFYFKELQKKGEWPHVKYYKGEWQNNKLLYGYLYFDSPRIGSSWHENKIEDSVQET